VQAESVVGNLWAWKYLSVPEGFERAQKAWEYISDRIVDRDGGEWWWYCDAEGEPSFLADKAGEWKCPYHNTRMCLQVLELV
jgi:mannobiose 2-epimerase